MATKIFCDVCEFEITPTAINCVGDPVFEETVRNDGRDIHIGVSAKFVDGGKHLCMPCLWDTLARLDPRPKPMPRTR